MRSVSPAPSTYWSHWNKSKLVYSRFHLRTLEAHCLCPLELTPCWLPSLGCVFVEVSSSLLMSSFLNTKPFVIPAGPFLWSFLDFCLRSPLMLQEKNLHNVSESMRATREGSQPSGSQANSVMQDSMWIEDQRMQIL